MADDFEAAKVIAEKLQGIPKARQERVLRWVAESLGMLAIPQAPANPPPAVPSPAPAAIPPVTPPANISHPVDIASHVREKRPRSDIQFVTVVAHYYKFVAPVEQRRNTITAAAAQDATRLADWDRLTDPKSTLANAKRQGYLDSRARGEYEINTVGENLVARSLPGNAESSGSGSAKASKPTRPTRTTKVKGARRKGR